MKKLISTILFTIFCMPTLYAKELNIGFINGQIIFQKYRGEIDNRLEREFNPRKEKVVKLQNELKEEAEKLARDEDTLTVNEMKKMQQDLQMKQRDFERLSQAYQEDFRVRGNQELDALGDKLQAAIDAIAKDKQFDIIFQRGAAVFIDDKYDITEEVIKRLGKERE